MRILITVKSLNNIEKLGGVGTYYNALKGHFSNNITYFSYSFATSKNIYFKYVKKLLHRIFNAFRLVIAFFIKKKRYQIVHINPSLSTASLLRDGFVILASFLSKKKIIVFFRGWHDYMEKKIDTSSIVRCFFKKTYGKADAFIVLSSAFQNKLAEWGFTQPIYIETTVVDDLLIAASVKSEQKKETKNKINILFLARVEKAKGVYETLEAYRLLTENHLNISLTIAGDGSYLNEIKQLARNKNLDIKFKGHVSGDEKSKTFAEGDIFLFPSYGEGMPNSVLEAMAFGLPVITRPVGGLIDFFEDGKMGNLTDSKDPKVFASLIEKLINNPELRKEISANNATFARKYFLASKVAKRLENIYEEVYYNKAVSRNWREVIDS